MLDLRQYVGIPYVDKGADPAMGLDCWQLVRHFYQRELATVLPDYMAFYDSSLNMRAAGEAIAHAIPEWVPVERALFGCVLVFRIHSGPWHTAVCVEQGRMLHTDKAHGSVIEPINGLRWRHRLYGIFKWKS